MLNMLDGEGARRKEPRRAVGASSTERQEAQMAAAILRQAYKRTARFVRIRHQKGMKIVRVKIDAALFEQLLPGIFCVEISELSTL